MVVNPFILARKSKQSFRGFSDKLRKSVAVPPIQYEGGSREKLEQGLKLLFYAYAPLNGWNHCTDVSIRAEGKENTPNMSWVEGQGMYRDLTSNFEAFSKAGHAILNCNYPSGVAYEYDDNYYNLEPAYDNFIFESPKDSGSDAMEAARGLISYIRQLPLLPRDKNYIEKELALDLGVDLTQWKNEQLQIKPQQEIDIEVELE